MALRASEVASARVPGARIVRAQSASAIGRVRRNNMTFSFARSAFEGILVRWQVRQEGGGFLREESALDPGPPHRVYFKRQSQSADLSENARGAAQAERARDAPNPKLPDSGNADGGKRTRRPNSGMPLLRFRRSGGFLFGRPPREAALPSHPCL